MTQLKEIKGYMKGYRSLDLAARDVSSMLNHYKDLKPAVEAYVFPDGKKEQLCRLYGTIPVSFRGSNYNIPIVIWLQKNHPSVNPIVYVKPTPDMSINPSRYVDTSGRIYLPYITEWKKDKSDLVTLVQVLCATFAENIPVYAKVQQAGYVAPPGVSYQPLPQQYGGGYVQQPPPPFPSTSQPVYSNNAPYPTQSSMPAPGNYRPYLQTSTYQPYSSQYPNYSQPQATSQPVVMSMEEERMKIEKEERQRAKIKRQSLESAVEEKIKRQLQNVFGRAEDEMAVLRNTEAKLHGNKKKIAENISQMDMKQHDVENTVQVLKEKTVELESLIDYVQNQPNQVDMDEIVSASTPLYNQILQLYAEENAIEDTIYYLGEALRKEVISHDIFLKHIRDLSRKQFMARATIMKARDAAKLSPYGTS